MIAYARFVPLVADSTCGAMCNSAFGTMVRFERQSAERVTVELSRNSQCVSATVPGEDGFQVSTSGPGFAGATFVLVLADAGASTLHVGGSPDPESTLRDGDVYTLRIADADSGQELFSHTESVKYDVWRLCGHRCLLGTSSPGFISSGARLVHARSLRCRASSRAP